MIYCSSIIQLTAYFLSTMKRELIWDLHSKQKNRIWINLAFLRLGLIYEQHLWTCKTSRNVTNTLSMKGHPIGTRTWELMNMKIPLAGYHGYGIVTMIHNYQCENTSNEEFNLFKQKATEHWWRESCLWRMWRRLVHSGSDENHVRAEGFQREYKKNLFVSNIYV